ncbi:Serine/threonine-protein phosphatase 2A regulatory subunit B'' subunit gamma [Araneus ventricosus]|uniref:Serine/threonine-protein phosphatase 2A regulatory subunit B'' subunit gamma n=1 Tax=Araneus ventricosus TaxID=182803 RepID=A0A4Y2AB06_ARAVE|nr:Serine/threonine-protein phosphatase 2A regulatory subunit B'' subunit gamma [Araneus ventricosus]
MTVESDAWELYTSWKKTPSTSNSIPRFYYKIPYEDGSLRQKLREEARAVFIERKNKELLDNEDLKELWMLLEQNLSPPFTNEDHMINYLDFKKVSNKSDEKFKSYFSARIFAKLLQNDKHGRISIRHFFNYVMRKVWLHQTRIGLSFYDLAGQGYLREVVSFNNFSINLLNKNVILSTT